MTRWEAETLLCRYEQATDAEHRRSDTPASAAASSLRDNGHTVRKPYSDEVPADESG